jgi:hypothetical protein
VSQNTHLARTITDPAFFSENPLYVVGRTDEKRSHYVRVGRGSLASKSLCGQEPGVYNWNMRHTISNICMACHAEACRMPCHVRKK